MSTQFFGGLVLTLLTSLAANASDIVVNDSDGTLGATRSPVIAPVDLNQSERRAAVEARIQLREVGVVSPASESVVPAQLFSMSDNDRSAALCWLMPPGPKGRRTFRLQEAAQTAEPELIAKEDTTSGQFDIAESGQQVLQYNYAPVEPGEFLTKVTPGNRIYARARSDYIHPLLGLDGETLTHDWSVDHPHHRGVYWAWPEVDWRGQRGDLHALQKVFSRPTGHCVTTSGPVFAQLEAENIWHWQTGEALVRERAVLRSYRATGDGRIIDLEFQFTALNGTVSLARRAREHYGGLNLRMASVRDQQIIFHTDPTNAAPRRAWAEFSGRFGDAPRPSGVVVLQNDTNPEYPGDWVKYPDINWFQPTFPAAGKRYALEPGQPLVLRFRLWLHRGGPTGEANCADHWQAYHSPVTPGYFPRPLNPQPLKSS